LHKQLPSEVTNALAFFHCFYCWKRQTALKEEEQEQCSLVNCLCLGQKAVKISSSILKHYLRMLYHPPKIAAGILTCLEKEVCVCYTLLTDYKWICKLIENSIFVAPIYYTLTYFT